MRKAGIFGMALTLAAGAALAAVPTEVSTLDGSKVTLHVQPFLTDEDLFTLRLVATNSEALSLFVQSRDGYAAIAVAPQDGFMKAGVLAASAFAIAGLPDAETAATQALAGCDAARKGGDACVIVLEINPAK